MSNNSVNVEKATGMRYPDSSSIKQSPPGLSPQSKFVNVGTITSVKRSIKAPGVQMKILSFLNMSS